MRNFRFDASRRAFEVVQKLLKKEKQVEVMGPEDADDWEMEVEYMGHAVETLWNDMHILARIEFVQAVVAELILKKEDEPS